MPHVWSHSAVVLHGSFLKLAEKNTKYSNQPTLSLQQSETNAGFICDWKLNWTHIDWIDDLVKQPLG